MQVLQRQHTGTQTGNDSRREPQVIPPENEERHGVWLHMFIITIIVIVFIIIIIIIIIVVVVVDKLNVWRTRKKIRAPEFSKHLIYHVFVVSSLIIIVINIIHSFISSFIYFYHPTITNNVNYNLNTILKINNSISFSVDNSQQCHFSFGSISTTIIDPNSLMLP